MHKKIKKVYCGWTCIDRARDEEEMVLGSIPHVCVGDEL